MSTLATNKIGTLAGTADISLPTTRPSSTLNANLNSAGNLTFAADTSTVEFFAAEDDSKVGMVLVDSQSIGVPGMSKQFTVPDIATWQSYYGINVGYFNAPASTQTNYLFPGNVRYYIFEGSYVNMGSGDEELSYGVLTRDQNALFNTATSNPSDQQQNYTYGPFNASSTNGSGAQNISGNRPYNSPADGLGYSATAGAGTIASFRVILKCGQNAAFATSTMQNMMGYNDSSTYAPSRSYWDKRTRNNQSTSTPSSYNDFGYPATEPGGISITHGTTGGNANRTSYMNVQCYAVIKPTPLVIS
ncbi:hypothetical protein N9909_00485 [bacterium]|nr:hypothetical protein [bacterium]